MDSRKTDVVAWFTLGFHHVPRPEDWPLFPEGFPLPPYFRITDARFTEGDLTSGMISLPLRN